MNDTVDTGVGDIDGVGVGVKGIGVEVAGSGVGDAGTGVAVKGTGVGVEETGVGVEELGVMGIVAIAVAGAAVANNGENDPHTAITLAKRARTTNTVEDVFRVLMPSTYKEGDNAAYRGETRGND